MIAKILLSAALCYAALVALAFVFQRSLLYQPTQQRPNGDALARLRLKPWPNAEEFRGYAGLSANSQPRATAIVFHGNAGAAHDRSYYVDALEPLGVQVILAEYPGYSGRGDSPSEDSIVEDARATVQIVRDQTEGPVYLWGESLGSSVVAALATDEALGIDGVVLITPWDSLPSVAQRHYWYLPARWLMHDRFDSVRHLSDYVGPAAVLVAAEDSIVPPEMGQRLYESLKARKRLWEFDGAGHNSWPVHPSAGWWHEVLEFLEP